MEPPDFNHGEGVRMDQKCNLKSKTADVPYDKETIFQIRIPMLLEMIKQLKRKATNSFF